MEKHKKTEPKLFPLLSGLALFFRKQQQNEGSDEETSKVFNPLSSIGMESTANGPI